MQIVTQIPFNLNETQTYKQHITGVYRELGGELLSGRERWLSGALLSLLGSQATSEDSGQKVVWHITSCLTASGSGFKLSGQTTKYYQSSHLTFSK